MNSGSFKDKGKNLLSEFEGGIKIYLESDDDQFIFKNNWFPNLNDKLSFESISEDFGTSGCRAVVTKVSQLNEVKVECYGIVDRDILLADETFNKTLWWEIDNQIFSSASPYGKNILVLHRWELENYLLQPQALSALISEKRLKESISSSEIAELLINNEEEFIAVTLLSTVSVRNQDKQPRVGFGSDKSGQALITEVADKLGLDAENFKSEREKISCFAENETTAIERWNKLSRMLDGKRVMHRLGNLLSRHDHDNLKLQLRVERGPLARHIASHQLIDTYLSDWVMNIYQSI
jgi:hypothetical protein